MREFNKVFVIALPRCATVTIADALGILGIRTAHLGHIYGEESSEHFHPQRLARMYEQIQANDFRLDILDICDGLADYPVCCMPVIKRLDETYPGSLFINVRRDQDNQQWLQSVERQFLGLQLIKQRQAASESDRSFMQTMLAFRTMTFGSATFSPAGYTAAYRNYQSAVSKYFAGRDCILDVDLSALATDGFTPLESFLNCPGRAAMVEFPNSNDHSVRPREAFMAALDAGEIVSQTGLLPSRVK